MTSSSPISSAPTKNGGTCRRCASTITSKPTTSCAASRRDDPALADVELIFHLGACSSTTERDAAYLIRNNFEYTKTLARWALAHDARFVYASSAATYGDGAAGMSDLELRRAACFGR